MDQRPPDHVISLKNNNSATPPQNVVEMSGCNRTGQCFGLEVGYCCVSDPLCAARAQILDHVPPTYPLPTRAVFRYALPADASVAQDVCLQPGVLELATVSVYINGTFVWCVRSCHMGIK